MLENCCIEPALKDAGPESNYQFLRHGYFCVDTDSADEKLDFLQRLQPDELEVVTPEKEPFMISEERLAEIQAELEAGYV